MALEICMLNVFTLDNGRLKGGLFQEEIESAEDLAQSRPIWVDLELPSAEEWTTAWDRCKLLMPDLYAMQCTMANLELLMERLVGVLQPKRQALLDLPGKLRQLCEAAQVSLDESPRLKHARLAADLLNLLEIKDSRERLTQLVRSRWSEVPEDLAAFIRGAQAMLPSLSQENLEQLAVLPTLEDGQEMLQDLREVMHLSEQSRPLGPVVELAKKQVFNLLRLRPVAPPPPPKLDPPPPTSQRLKQGNLQAATPAQAKAELNEILEFLKDPKVRVNFHYEVWKEA